MVKLLSKEMLKDQYLSEYAVSKPVSKSAAKPRKRSPSRSADSRLPGKDPRKAFDAKHLSPPGLEGLGEFKTTHETSSESGGKDNGGEHSE